MRMLEITKMFGFYSFWAFKIGLDHIEWFIFILMA